MAISVISQNFGICYFDVSTFKCYLASFDDDCISSTLRNIIAQIRPVEIIYDQKSSIDKNSFCFVGNY